MAGDVAFTLVADDLADMQRTLIRRGLMRRRFLARMGGLVAIAFVVGVAGQWMMGQAPVPAMAVAAAGIVSGMVILIGMLGLIYALVPQRAGRIFAQQRSLHGTMTFAWDADGFALHITYGSMRYPWADMTAWMTGRRCVIIMASDATGHFVPLRALSADQHRDLDATLAASGLPRR